MVEYKVIKNNKDKEACKEYCIKNNFRYRDNAVYIAAFDCNKNIVGLISVIKVTQIQSFISENPLISHVLSEKALAISSIYDNEVQATVCNGNEKWIDELEKYGFEVIDKNVVVLEKDV